MENQYQVAENERKFLEKEVEKLKEKLKNYKNIEEKYVQEKENEENRYRISNLKETIEKIYVKEQECMEFDFFLVILCPIVIYCNQCSNRILF